MTHFRTALAGIAALVLVIAFLVACTSSDDQAEQQRTEQTSAASSPQPDQQTQQRPAASTEQSDEEQRDDSASRDAQASSGSQQDDSRQQDGQEQTATVAATDDQQGEDAKAQTTQDVDEDQAQQQQAQDQPAQQQDQPQPEAQSTDQQERPEADQSDDPQEQDEQQEQQGLTERERLQLRAEEISAQATVSDLVGLNGWLNGEETSIALELAKGNVVLIDFWTYTCINCVRTLPFLTAWDEKYRDHGLVILGVHTPEFEFEKIPDNIRAAIAEHGIEYNVPMDNDYRTWRAFNNRFWPAKYLIGPTDDSPMGVRYFHFGEGHYEETEVEIRAALTAAGRDISNVSFGVEAAIPTRQGGTPRQTRELYAGWSRNIGGGGPYAGQDAYFLAGTGIDTLYRDIDLSDRQHNLWYLEGLWRTDAESIIHARETDDLEDYIALLVRGRTANVVLTVAEDGEPFNVYVELDGRWLLPNEAGAHVQWDEQGRSYIRVTENDLYRLLFLPEWSEHELKLRSDSDQFRIFAFTFGSYVGGE